MGLGLARLGLGFRKYKDLRVGGVFSCSAVLTYTHSSLVWILEHSRNKDRLVLPCGVSPRIEVRPGGSSPLGCRPQLGLKNCVRTSEGHEEPDRIQDWIGVPLAGAAVEHGQSVVKRENRTEQSTGPRRQQWSPVARVSPQVFTSCSGVSILGAACTPLTRPMSL